MASDLQERALSIISEAVRDRLNHVPWQRDVDRYGMPHRKRPDDWQQQHDQDDLFDATAVEATSDFGADMQNKFTPMFEDWLEVQPVKRFGEGDLTPVKRQIKEYGRLVFEKIRDSNFHEATQECYPDLAAGTCGIIIQDIDANLPIHNQAVPLPDLLITRGTFGGVDGRIRCLVLRKGDLKSIYPGAKIPPDILKASGKEAQVTVKVKECFWRLRDNPRAEKWQYVLLIQDIMAQDAVLEGVGSCPLIIGRWKTDSTTAWGIGPLYHAIPTIKTLDQLTWLILKKLNLNVDPPIAYDNDGIFNLEQGVIPGRAYARAKGSQHDIIESNQSFDPAFFERANMQADIKRALFQERPDQRGKTPPTASQWLDERADEAARMGAPGGRMVTEWQIPIFERYQFLLDKRGILPKISVKGDELRLRPQSPLAKAQRQDSVLITDRALELIQARFGEEAMGSEINAERTMKKIVDRLGAELIDFNTPDEKKKMAEAAAVMFAAQQGGLGAGGGGEGELNAG